MKCVASGVHLSVRFREDGLSAVRLVSGLSVHDQSADERIRLFAVARDGGSMRPAPLPANGLNSQRTDIQAKNRRWTGQVDWAI